MTVRGLRPTIPVVAAVLVACAVCPLRAMQTCESADEDAPTRVLTGTVRSSATGSISPGAHVIVSEQSSPSSVTGGTTHTTNVLVADGDGRYRVCGLHLDRRITVYARSNGEVSEFVSLEFAAAGVIVEGDRRHPFTGSEWTRDLTLTPSGERLATLTGTVTDGATGRPVAMAAVSLLGTGAVAETDFRGAFEISGIISGSHQLAVRRMGYRPRNFRLRIPSGGRSRIPADQLRLDPLPRQLQPIVVETEGHDNPKLASFYQRRERGVGDFITRAEFEQYNPIVTTDILRKLPSLRIRPNPNYGMGTPMDMRRYVVESSRAVATPLGAECPAVLFVDGTFVGTTLDTEIDDIVFATDIEAIEAYNHGNIPPQFNYLGGSCGVIVVWTS